MTTEAETLAAAEAPPNAGEPTDDFKAPIAGGSDPVVRQDCSSAGSVSRHSEPAPPAPIKSKDKP